MNPTETDKSSPLEFRPDTALDQWRAAAVDWQKWQDEVTQLKKEKEEMRKGWADCIMERDELLEKRDAEIARLKELLAKAGTEPKPVQPSDFTAPS